MHALRSYLKLNCEYELHSLPNKKVSGAKDHGKNYIKAGGGEGRGEQRRGLRMKALMRDLETRPECRHKTFCKNSDSNSNSKPDSNLLPDNSARFSVAHDFPTAPSPHHGKS